MEWTWDFEDWPCSVPSRSASVWLLRFSLGEVGLTGFG
jgi:hypothetical protein